MDPCPPVNVLEIATQILGHRRLNGTTGLLQQHLNRMYPKSTITIDSSVVAKNIAQAALGDEHEYTRAQSVLAYALCETQNHNTFVLSDQLSLQGGVVRTLEKAYANRAILPRVRTELSLLANGSLLVEVPGFPGKTVDIRALASTVHIAEKASNSDRWRQLTRGILDKVLPLSVQRVYTGAVKGGMYFPLPEDFVNAIQECCAISSSFDEAGTTACAPAISFDVRQALTHRLNDVKKKQSKNVKELVRLAMADGWSPPNIAREEALEQLEQAGVAGEPAFLEHLKPRGPIEMTEDSEAVDDGRPPQERHKQGSEETEETAGDHHMNSDSSNREEDYGEIGTSSQAASTSRTITSTPTSSMNTGPRIVNSGQVAQKAARTMRGTKATGSVIKRGISGMTPRRISGVARSKAAMSHASTPRTGRPRRGDSRLDDSTTSRYTLNMKENDFAVSTVVDQDTRHSMIRDEPMSAMSALHSMQPLQEYNDHLPANHDAYGHYKPYDGPM